MNSKATITLAPGQACFYDELSGIYLNLEQKSAIVSENMNVYGLLKAVADGKILVVTGSLDLVTNYINRENSLPNYYRIIKKKHKKISPAVMNKKSIDTGVNENKNKEINNKSEEVKVIKEEEEVKEEVKKKTRKKKTKVNKKGE